MEQRSTPIQDGMVKDAERFRWLMNNCVSRLDNVRVITKEVELFAHFTKEEVLTRPHPEKE